MANPSGAIIFVSGDGPPDPPANSADVALFAVNGQLGAINGDGNAFPLGSALLCKFSGTCPAGGDDCSLADTGTGTAPSANGNRGFVFPSAAIPGSFAIAGWSLHIPECDYDVLDNCIVGVYVNGSSVDTRLINAVPVTPQSYALLPPSVLPADAVIEFRVLPGGASSGSCLVYGTVLIGPAPAEVPQ